MSNFILDFFSGLFGRQTTSEDLPKTVLVICTHNEYKYNQHGYRNLVRTLDLIKDTGLPLHIVVVDDGSKDGTKDYLERRVKLQNNLTVVSLPENLGKADAFFMGLRKAYTFGPESIVTLDADMVTIPRKSLLQMILLSSQKTGEGKSYMCVANQEERSELHYKIFLPSDPQISGMRAFSRQAISKIFFAPHINSIKGFFLEPFLEDLFKEEKEFLRKVKFRTEYPYKTDESRRSQETEIPRFRKLLEERRTQRESGKQRMQEIHKPEFKPRREPPK